MGGQDPRVYCSNLLVSINPAQRTCVLRRSHLDGPGLIFSDFPAALYSAVDDEHIPTSSENSQVQIQTHVLQALEG
jgi:hypothetical protein